MPRTQPAPRNASAMTTRKGVPKYARVAAAVRGQIAEGILRPGQPAPSGAALSRITGYSTLTCRRALRVLIADGVLTPGPSRNARPRVAGPPQPPAERDLAAASRALAAGLATRRRAKRLTQPRLAGSIGVSVTTVGHAETGRLWQSRQFWERADEILRADGDLLRLHDAYLEASASSAAYAAGAYDAAGTADPAPGSPAQWGQDRRDDPGGTLPPQGHWAQWSNGTAERVAPPDHDLPVLPGAADSRAPACVMIVWSDGTVTTVRPPEADAT